MQTILIVIHLMVVITLVTLVLMQRSEGGGLGIGGGGGGGMMKARTTGNGLTRATGILAVAFFATSLGLSILARYGGQPTDILDRVPVNQQQQTVPTGQGGVLDQLGGETPQAPPSEPGPAAPQVPSGQ